MKGTTETKVAAPQSPKPEKNGGAIEKKPRYTKDGKNYVPKGIGNGGKRERSGRKEKEEKIKAIGITETLEQHLLEEVDVVEVNAQTQKRTVTKKPTVRALLDMLRYEALKNKNVKAAKEYMDRTLGRAKQTVDMSTEIVTEDEQRLPTKAERAAAKAYLAALEDEE